MRDVNAFRERFNYWKSTGELPYEAGLPKYTGGKNDGKLRFSKNQQNTIRRMYNLLKEDGYDERHLELFLVRLLFCVYAQSTGIFKPYQFTDYICNEKDVMNVGPKIQLLFRIYTSIVYDIYY